MGWQPVDGGPSTFALTSDVNRIAANPIKVDLHLFEQHLKLFLSSKGAFHEYK